MHPARAGQAHRRARILSKRLERSYTAALLRGALSRRSRHGLRHGEEAMDPLNLIRFVPA